MPFYPLLIKHNLVPCQSSKNSSCENGTCSALCICCWGLGRPVRERCDLAPLCFGPLCGRRSWKPSWHLVGQFWCCFASLNSCCLRELAQQSWQVSVPVTGCRAPWGTGRAARKHRKKIQWPRGLISGREQIRIALLCCITSHVFVFRGEDLAELSSWSSRYRTDVLHLR